jgi:hypothetical protein
MKSACELNVLPHELMNMILLKKHEYSLLKNYLHSLHDIEYLYEI